MLILDIGCGRDKFKGLAQDDQVIGVDLGLTPGVDVVADLTTPLPFADKVFDFVNCQSVLEHLYIEQLERLLAEIIRVSKEGARVRVYVPHFSSPRGRADLDHRVTNWASNSFYSYQPGHWAAYARKVKFYLLRTRFVWHEAPFLYIPNVIISAILNLSPVTQYAYENFLGLPWFFPMCGVEMLLEIPSEEVRLGQALPKYEPVGSKSFSLRGILRQFTIWQRGARKALSWPGLR